MECAGDSGRCSCIGVRFLRRGVRRRRGVRTVSGSGPGSRAGSRPRTPRLRPACRHRWRSGGSATLGGVNPGLAPTVSGRYLCSAEREDIALWRAQGAGVREIARAAGLQPVDLRSILREYFPAALTAFHVKHVGLASPEARAVLAAAPTPAAAARLTKARLRSLLTKSGRTPQPRNLGRTAPQLFRADVMRHRPGRRRRLRTRRPGHPQTARCRGHRGRGAPEGHGSRVRAAPPRTHHHQLPGLGSHRCQSPRRTRRRP